MDILRLFPEYAFFQQERVREMMLRILFVWARENPAVEYRQGMHEVLAPVLFVLITNALPGSGQDAAHPTGFVLADDYVEHDGYHMFERIMRTSAPWFVSGQRKKGAPAPRPKCVCFAPCRLASHACF